MKNEDSAESTPPEESPLIKRLSVKIDSLIRERNQYAAQVARLRKASKNAQCDCPPSWRDSGHATGCWMSALTEVLSESPIAALRQLKREWIGPTIPVLERAARIFCDHSCAEELTRLTAILEEGFK